MASEFGQAWRPLLGATVGAGCGLTSIVFYTHGVFAVPIAEATGWLRAEVQFAFTLMSLVALLTAPSVGWLIDRYGARRVGLWGVIWFFAGLALLSRASSSLVVYYAGFVAMAVLGAGTLPVTWTTVVNQWFSQRRGLALGIALSGTGIAASVAPAYAGWLISQFGWQDAYLVLALTATAIALPVTYFFFWSPAPENAQVASASTAAQASDAHVLQGRGGYELGEALRSYRLWVICSAIALVAGSVAGMITSFVALMIDKSYGFDEAVGFAGAIGISVILGRLIAGVLVDRYWAPAVAAVLLLCPAAAALALDMATITPLLATVCAALIGLAAGAELDLLAYFSSRYFGLRRYGSIYGIGFVFFSVAAGLTPAAFGWVHDAYGDYSLALRTAAVCCTIGALGLLSLGAYPVFRDQGR